MITFVGLGLWDEQSVTAAGEAAIGAADRVFAEFYTSRLGGATLDDLERYHDTQFELRARAGVEEDPEPILDAAKNGEAVFCTAGDAMIATTHIDLHLRAHVQGIETRVIHGTTAAATSRTKINTTSPTSAATIWSVISSSAWGRSKALTVRIDGDQPRYRAVGYPESQAIAA